MLLNGCRYGALSSSTHTYFVRMFDEDGGNVAENVAISDACFVGEKNYLRAWAYIYSLTSSEDAFFALPAENPGISWAGSDEEFQPDNEARGARSTRGDDGEPESGHGCGESGSIPHESLGEIKSTGVVGYGRNGCVIRALWKGKEVAVKQFDCGRQGGLDRFNSEVKAYEMLKDVRGVLVPKAFFVSELSGLGIKYLGLQLGRDPDQEDDTINRFKVLSTLREKYGIKHKDSIGRNGLIIADDSGNERMVVIDWEEYDLEPPWWQDTKGKLGCTVAAEQLPTLRPN